MSKLGIVLLLVFITSFFLIILIDKRVNVILDQYINIEVERLTTNIVSRAVSEVMAKGNYGSLLVNDSGNLGSGHVSYNTEEINKITDDISLYVHNKLINLEVGDIEDLFLVDRFRGGKFKNIKNGFLCDISLGSVKNSSIFANIGPRIPIRLTFIGQVSSEADVKVREYGINNVIVQIDVVVRVYEHASMPLTSRKKEIIVREPMSIEIIKGEIPDYYSGSLS